MGQAAPEEEILSYDRKKVIQEKDRAWEKFQKTLWLYYFAQWIWVVIFCYCFYICSQEQFSIQQLWLKLSFEPLTKANELGVSGDYLLILLLAMPLLFLTLTKVLKGLIKQPIFSLKAYNLFSVIKAVLFILAGHLVGYVLGTLFICSLLYLNFTLKKT